jgi:hypothetical protein
VQDLAVLAAAAGEVVVHGLAPPDALHEAVDLRVQIVGHEEGDVPAHRLLGGVAVHALGSPVPGKDHPVQVLAEDGVVRPLNDGGKMHELEAGVRAHLCPPAVSR